MEELADIARSAGAWIVCDEMYRGLKRRVYAVHGYIYDKSHSHMQLLEDVFHGRSPLRLDSLPRRKNCAGSCSTAALTIPYAAVCLTNGSLPLPFEHADKILERSRKIVSRNKAVVDKWLDSHPYLHQYADAYGTTYLIHYDLDVDSEKFCDDLLDKKAFSYATETVSTCLTHSGFPYPMRKSWKKGLALIDEYIRSWHRDAEPPDGPNGTDSRAARAGRLLSCLV